MRVILNMLPLLGAAAVVSMLYAQASEGYHGEPIVPESSLVEAEDAFITEDTLNEDEDTFTAAHTKLTELLDRKKISSDMCISGAMQSIRSVLKEVGRAQKTLNGANNGSHCATKRQREVTAAKLTVNKRKRDLTLAQRKLTQAQTAPITLTISYATANTNCNTMLATSAWQTARTTVKTRSKAVTTAIANLANAKKTSKLVLQEAWKARCKCKARVTKAAKKALEAALAMTANRKKTILREEMLMCLVKARRQKGKKGNAAFAKCKTGKWNAKYNRALRLKQLKLVPMKFKCNNTNKHRGIGHRLNDSCHGFRRFYGCGGGNIALQAYQRTVWQRYATYKCPPGWYWPNAAKYFSNLAKFKCYSNNGASVSQKDKRDKKLFGGRTHTNYAYMYACGWKGYRFGGKTRYHFVFKDSKRNCRYQHSGNYPGYQHSTNCGSQNFGGIACLKNGT